MTIQNTLDTYYIHHIEFINFFNLIWVWTFWLHISEQFKNIEIMFKFKMELFKFIIIFASTIRTL